jgi:hypothetical protein
MEYLREPQIPNAQVALALLEEADASLVFANKAFAGHRDLAQVVEMTQLMVAALRRSGMYGLQELLRGGQPSEDAVRAGVEHLERAGKAVREAATKTFDQREYKALVKFSEEILLIRKGIMSGKVRVEELDGEQRKALRSLAAKLMGGGLSDRKRASLEKARQARSAKRSLEKQRAEEARRRGLKPNNYPLG